MNQSKPFSGAFLLVGVIITFILFLQGVKVSFDSVANGMKWQEGRRSTNLEDQRSEKDKNIVIDPITPSIDSITPSIDSSPTKDTPTNGIINRTIPGYQGWNLRTCPSLSSRCLDVTAYVDSGESVVILFDVDPVYANGIQWIKIKSVRLNKEGWIASSGVSY